MRTKLYPGRTNIVATLDKLHARHALPGFADRTAEEKEIEKLTTDITKVRFVVRRFSARALFFFPSRLLRVTVFSSCQIRVCLSLESDLLKLRLTDRPSVPPPVSNVCVHPCTPPCPCPGAFPHSGQAANPLPVMPGSILLCIDHAECLRTPP
jgi:hypothetical protein